MAELPDLDTTQVSFISYYNVLDDGGVSSIDPEDTLSASRVRDYELYDNGVQGDYELDTGREARFRVKSDGWMLMWLDRTENFNTRVDDPDQVRGGWDIISDWTAEYYTYNIAGGDNNLQNGIEALVNEFENLDDITLVSTDIGTYNYEYPNGTTVAHLSAEGVGDDVSVSYTSDTTLEWGVYVGAVDSSSTSNRIEDFLDNTIAQGNAEFGTVDATIQLADPETTYSAYVGENRNTASLLVIFS